MEYVKKLFSLHSVGALISFLRHLKSATAVGPLPDMSYTIRHKYPRRLVTYDAEELHEPRIIRFSDLTHSAMNIKSPNSLRGSHKNRIDRRPHKSRRPSINIGKLSNERMRRLESASRALYRIHMKRKAASSQQESHVKWESLTPIQKFRFYWKALTYRNLHATPYKNFKEIYLAHLLKHNPGVSVKRMTSLVRDTWYGMTLELRMPFTLQALIYQASIGRVDPFDKEAVQALLTSWH